MKRKEDLNFQIKIKSTNLYMAEHLSSTIYFQPTKHRVLINSKARKAQRW